MMATAVAAALLLANDSGLAQTSDTGSAGQSTDTYRALSLFGDVFSKIKEDYVEPVSNEKLIEAAINGMLSSLDPHSGYMNAKAFQDMQIQTRGEFGGLGIEVTMENGLVKVVSPIDDTPAAKAGIKPGDLIIALDGEQVMGMTLEDAVEKMRGPVNSTIKLTIQRDKQKPFEVTLKRAVIKIQAVRSHLYDNVGYVRISSFSEQADEGVKAAIAKFKKDLGNRKLAGLILDLRNNPGGLLDQAVAVSDDFLDRGEIVSTRGRHADDIQRFNAHGHDLVAGVPMVVLINGGSASASEIVAGALQDHHRAVLMGTRSFGKGSVQTIIPLGTHGAMRLTTARYYTPSGRSIQARGIEPDIVVPEAKIEKVAEPEFRTESELKGALPNDTPAPKPQSAVGPNGKAEPAEPVEGEDLDKAVDGDYQLARALDLLRGMALFQQKVAN
ncbi:MAG TPA: S41 family peptidase [Alphaproteobacteria bacterium]|nr:S41 family peptidase [Alphaproteobacteria bacterium]